MSSPPPPTPPLSAPAALPVLHLGPERVAIVPLERLSWHTVTLPTGALGRGAARNRLRAVLAGLLEEQLLDEPAALHFALQPDAVSGAAIWVAVCDLAWLRAQLQALERHGHSPQRLVPECCPLHASTEPVLRFDGVDGAPTVTWADDKGVHRIPVSPEVTAAQVLPPLLLERAQARAEPAVAAWAERWLGRPLEVETAEERLREAARGRWNLAQFDLVRRSPVWQRLVLAAHALWHGPAWKPARWATTALVLVQLIGLNLWAWRATAQEQAQRDAIRAVLQSSFPSVTVIIDPVVQMQRQVASQRQQSGVAGPADLEVQLAALGAYAASVPEGFSSAALEFAGGETRLRGPVLAPPQLEVLNQSLQAHGLRARLDDSDATLVIRSSP